jgi:hypothetical protein
MSEATRPSGTPPWWKVHDLIVGFLSGFGVGTVAGLFVNRLFENNVVVLMTAILGAVAGVYVLTRNHQEAGRFVTAVVVVSWVLLALSAAFIGMLAWAVATFE